MPFRFRDDISQPLTLDYFQERLSEGWTITAVEWARPLGGDDAVPSEKEEEVPYALRVADDCESLIEHSREMEVVALIYDGVIAGLRPAHIAVDLNKRDYRTRAGQLWTASAVFQLMPRIIELSPRLQRRPDWPGHRAKLHVIA